MRFVKIGNTVINVALVTNVDLYATFPGSEPEDYNKAVGVSFASSESGFFDGQIATRTLFFEGADADQARALFERLAAE